MVTNEFETDTNVRPRRGLTHTTHMTDMSTVSRFTPAACCLGQCPAALPPVPLPPAPPAAPTPNAAPATPPAPSLPRPSAPRRPHVPAYVVPARPRHLPVRQLLLACSQRSAATSGVCMGSVGPRSMHSASPAVVRQAPRPATSPGHAVVRHTRPPAPCACQPRLTKGAPLPVCHVVAPAAARLHGEFAHPPACQRPCGHVAAVCQGCGAGQGAARARPRVVHGHEHEHEHEHGHGHGHAGPARLRGGECPCPDALRSRQCVWQAARRTLQRVLDWRWPCITRLADCCRAPESLGCHSRDVESQWSGYSQPAGDRERVHGVVHACGTSFSAASHVLGHQQSSMVFGHRCQCTHPPMDPLVWFAS
jgi:hypothetical protein